MLDVMQLNELRGLYSLCKDEEVKVNNSNIKWQDAIDNLQHAEELYNAEEDQTGNVSKEVASNYANAITIEAKYENEYDAAYKKYHKAYRALLNSVMFHFGLTFSQAIEMVGTPRFSDLMEGIK